jgi:hypothetical protein
MRQLGPLAFTTTLLTLALPGAARGEEASQPTGFGALGQIAVSADLQLDVVHRSQGNGSRTTVVIRPALDYFLMPNVSVGGFVGFSSGSASFGPLAGNTDLTEFSLGARAGYNLRIADTLSLWGQARLVYSHDTFTPPAGPGTGGSIFSVSLYAPLLFHPAPHFFVGAGPVLSQEIVDSVASQSTATDFGLLSIVGGYFGL